MPADAELLSCTNLSADESLLTGESVSVRKICSDGKTAMAESGGDDLPFIYSGSLIVQGQGAALVKATVQKLAILGLSLCALVVVIYGITRGDWLQGFF